MDRNRKNEKNLVIRDKLKQTEEKLTEVLYNEAVLQGGLNSNFKRITSNYLNKEGSLYNAPLVIAFILSSNNHIVDAAIAAKRVELMAHYLRLSSFFCGNLVHGTEISEELKFMMNLNSKELMPVALALGHSDVCYKRPIYRKLKKVVII